MLRKILRFSTKVGAELFISRAVKSIAWLNALLLKNGWSDKNDANAPHIHTIIAECFSANHIPLHDKRILEIGSGRAYSLGSLFVGLSNAKSFLASDPYNKYYDDETPPVDARGVVFEKIDFTNRNEVQNVRERFDIVLSIAVLEHINRAACEIVVQNMNTALTQGGYAFHQIDFKDHFSGKVRPFNFYKYTAREWDVATENTIFYTNRLRCSDWVNFFKKNGFEIVALHKYRKEDPPFPKRIAEDFKPYSRDDLEIRACDILVRKI
jgi:hypothetical protein